MKNIYCINNDIIYVYTPYLV